MATAKRKSASSAKRQSGVVAFAGVLFFIVGVFNVIDGLVAILNSAYFVDTTLFGSVTAWGWVILAIGVVQILVGGAILNRTVGGQIAGIFLASFAAIVQLAFIAAFPAWSIIVIAICGVIIYALTVHADEFV
jgi:hypothetical protein